VEIYQQFATFYVKNCGKAFIQSDFANQKILRYKLVEGEHGIWARRPSQHIFRNISNTCALLFVHIIPN